MLCFWNSYVYKKGKNMYVDVQQCYTRKLHHTKVDAINFVYSFYIIMTVKISADIWHADVSDVWNSFINYFMTIFSNLDLCIFQVTLPKRGNWDKEIKICNNFV